ncbi:MAG TPA: aspartyl protease family protein, partial [Gemmatimonadaceae bacterium]|nr:aspartyl protease family protein [Gemmatimonadaceae bacterium]
MLRLPTFRSHLRAAVVAATIASVLAGCGGAARTPSTVRAAASGGVRLPATFNESYVFLRATIAGRPTLLLFDSGASSTLLSAQLVRQLGLAERGRRVTFGLGATAVQATAYDGVTLDFGGTRITTPAVLTWPDLDLPVLHGERAQGIVGADLLRARVVEIDWQGEAVLSWDSATVVRPGPDEDELRLDIVQNLPVLTVRALGRGLDDS